jgi:AcrR family transcriptional regulator
MRDHLLHAALRAFAAGGYEGTSIKRVAAEAKVAPALLYHYFPSKEALLLALFAQNQAQISAPFLAMAAVEDPREQLGTLLRLSATSVKTNLDFWRLTHRLRHHADVLASLGDGVAAWNQALIGAFTALLTAIGRPTPEVEALLLFGAMDGVFQHYVLVPEGYPLDAVIGTLIAHFGGAEPALPPTPTAAS